MVIFSRRESDLKHWHRRDSEIVLGDRSFLDQMKEDILRRAAELSESEEEYELDEHGKRVQIVAFEDELEENLNAGIRVAGDGEATSDEDSEEDIEVLLPPW